MACKRSSVRPRYSPQRLTFVSLLYFMSFLEYIIYSPSLDQYYIGQTENLEDRLFRHNNSGSKSTKKVNDWILKYSEEFSTRGKAIQRELQIKNKKSRKYIESLISSFGQGAPRMDSGRSSVQPHHSPQRLTFVSLLYLMSFPVYIIYSLSLDHLFCRIFLFDNFYVYILCYIKSVRHQLSIGGDLANRLIIRNSAV